MLTSQFVVSYNNVTTARICEVATTLNTASWNNKQNTFNYETSVTVICCELQTKRKIGGHEQAFFILQFYKET